MYNMAFTFSLKNLICLGNLRHATAYIHTTNSTSHGWKSKYKSWTESPEHLHTNINITGPKEGTVKNDCNNTKQCEGNVNITGGIIDMDDNRHDINTVRML